MNSGLRTRLLTEAPKPRTNPRSLDTTPAHPTAPRQLPLCGKLKTLTRNLIIISIFTGAHKKQLTGENEALPEGGGAPTAAAGQGALPRACPPLHHPRGCRCLTERRLRLSSRRRKRRRGWNGGGSLPYPPPPRAEGRAAPAGTAHRQSAAPGSPQGTRWRAAAGARPLPWAGSRPSTCRALRSGPSRPARLPEGGPGGRATVYGCSLSAQQ